MGTKQTQGGAGLSSKHGPSSALQKARTGHPDEGAHAGLWIHEEMAGIFFLGQQTLV